MIFTGFNKSVGFRLDNKIRALFLNNDSGEGTEPSLEWSSFVTDFGFRF